MQVMLRIRNNCIDLNIIFFISFVNDKIISWAFPFYSLPRS